MGIKVGNKKDNYLKLSQIKKKIKPEKLCENLPVELIDYMKYVKNLQFEENPDYGYLKFLFEKMIKKQGLEIENLYFSWISLSSFQKIKKPVDLSKRTSYSRERILNNIKKKLDSNRSFSEIRKINSFNNCNDCSNNRVTNNIFVKRNLGDQFIKSSIKNNSNANTPNTNYINNSINNNFISISVSLQKSINGIQNDLNQNNRLKNNQNIKQLDINKICSENEINDAISEVNYKLNMNINNKNKNRIYLEKNTHVNNKMIYNNNVINNLKSFNNSNRNNSTLYDKKYYSSDINNMNNNSNYNNKYLFEKNNYNINNNNNNKNLYVKKIFKKSNNIRKGSNTNSIITHIIYHTKI
jgi:hypothetical protein